MPERNKLPAIVLTVAMALTAGAQPVPIWSNPPEWPGPAKPAAAHTERVLTSADCIQLALQHNLDIQIQRYYPILDQIGVHKTYAAFEPAYNGSFTRGFNSSPSESFSASTGTRLPPFLENYDNWNSSVGGVLPSGLNYNLSSSLSRLSPVDSDVDYVASPVLTLSQPVLRNFLIDNNRLQILLSKKVLASDQQALRLKVMTVITSVKTAYFNLMYARAQVRVNKEAVDLADQLVRENKKRVEVGSLAPLDERQSESQAASSMASLESAEQTLVTDENILKNLITDNFSEWVNANPIPSEELTVMPQELDRQESWRKALLQRPEMIEARIAVEKQNITIKYDKNQLYPEVDLLGSYGHNASDGSIWETYGDLRDGTYPSYYYGFKVSVPLGNRAARDTYRADSAAAKQILLQLKQQEQNIVIAVDNDISTIRSDLQQVNSTHEARVYAEEALAAEQKKLANGKSTSFVVLQLQSNLTAARSSEIQAQANYNIALEQLSMDEGSTLERNHIDWKVN